MFLWKLSRPAWRPAISVSACVGQRPGRLPAVSCGRWLWANLHWSREIGAFLELPEEVAVKIPVDEREVNWLFEHMKVLLDEPALVRAVGECGRAYVAQECSWPKVAAEYVQFLEQCLVCESAARKPEAWPTAGVPAAAEPSRTSFSSQELEEYIVGFSHASRRMEEYVLLHRKRLARTVEITPPGPAPGSGAGTGLLSAFNSGAEKKFGLWRSAGRVLWPSGQN